MHPATQRAPARPPPCETMGSRCRTRQAPPTAGWSWTRTTAVRRRPAHAGAELYRALCYESRRRQPRVIRQGHAFCRVGHTLRRIGEVRLPHAQGIKHRIGGF
eukprot:174928-Prymnesium_polylepis.1